MSMLETLFAFWVVCFILLIVANLFPSSMLAIRRGESEIVAANLAQSTLEQLRSGAFADLRGGPGTDASGPDGTVFHPSIEVLDVPGSSPQRLKRVRVTVAWQQQSQGPRSLTQELMICNLVDR